MSRLVSDHWLACRKCCTLVRGFGICIPPPPFYVGCESIDMILCVKNDNPFWNIFYYVNPHVPSRLPNTATVKYRGKHSLLTFPKLGNSANCTLSSRLYLTNTHVFVRWLTQFSVEGGWVLLRCFTVVQYSRWNLYCLCIFVCRFFFFL